MAERGPRAVRGERAAPPAIAPAAPAKQDPEVEDDHRVIDLSSYLRRKEEASSRARTTCALWGGEGERSRFALPLWRSAYLAGGRRSALLWQPPGAAPGGDPAQPLVVLDLGEDPARASFDPGCLSGLDGVEQPGTVVVSPRGLAVYLGEGEGRYW